tara:strand:- start:2394 stop:2528 length:135 start_codon:yes stop_codon:yes gene_type:complete
MNPLLIAGVTLLSSLILYVTFLGIGFGSVSKNRKAQGLDKKEGN